MNRIFCVIIILLVALHFWSTHENRGLRMRNIELNGKNAYYRSLADEYLRTLADHMRGCDNWWHAPATEASDYLEI